MTRDSVTSWIDRYFRAWRSYDPRAIAGLFTVDATYAYNPWDDPLLGNAAIVESWLSDQDEPGTWEAEYRVAMVTGDTAIIIGETQYAEGRRYSNLFQVTFDEEGRCSSFVEWYMPHPEKG